MSEYEIEIQFGDGPPRLLTDDEVAAMGFKSLVASAPTAAEEWTPELTAEFLARLPMGYRLARHLDADERAARAATEGPWAWAPTGEKDSSWAVGRVQDEDGSDLRGQLEPGQGVVIDGVCESISGRLADAAHIARWDPVRVLRDVDAKRRVLALYEAFKAEAERDGRSAGSGLHGAMDVLHEAVRALVEAYLP